MRQVDSKAGPKKPYEAPKLIEVQVDPQKELLMATACIQFANPGVPADPCNQNPC